MTAVSTAALKALAQAATPERAKALAEYVLALRDDADENEGYGAFYVRGDKLGNTGADATNYYLPTHPFPDTAFKTDLRTLCAEFLALVGECETLRQERDEARRLLGDFTDLHTRLAARCAELEAALGFYADPTNYEPDAIYQDRNVLDDGGRLARDALAGAAGGEPGA